MKSPCYKNEKFIESAGNEYEIENEIPKLQE
jgi:hypothetical protein